MTIFSTRPVVCRIKRSAISLWPLRAVVARGLSAVFPLEQFQGQRVLIKPNFCGPGSNKPVYSMSDLRLVGALATIAKKAGAAQVTVADHPAGYVENTGRFFAALGVPSLADRVGFNFVDLRSQPFEKIGGFNLSAIVRAHDVIINAALPKTHHEEGTLTLCMKNLAMGLLAAEEREKAHHQTGLSEAIVRANLAIKNERPVVHILDGRFGQEGMGPHFGDPVKLNFMIFGTDPVAVDAIGAGQVGFDPAGMRTIQLAQESGLGSAEPEVIGDKVPVYRLKPSPPWKLGVIDENRVVVFWLPDSRTGMANLFKLNWKRLAYESICQKPQGWNFKNQTTLEDGARWLFEDGGFSRIFADIKP